MTSPSAHGADVDADAERLVARLRAAGCVFAEEEAALLITEAADRNRDAGGDASRADRGAELERMTAARVAGEPLETVLGWVAFAGRRIIVRPGVFVPRRRTERLAGAATEAARAAGRGASVVDLCCGTAAIGAVIADDVPGVVVHAADIDPVAVACAQENLGPRGGAVHLGDLLGALPVGLRGRIDVLVANVPYVPRDRLASMPPEARLHEPVATRDGGSDGLEILRRVADEGAAWLAPGGVVLMEVSGPQAEGALAAIRAAGLEAAASARAVGTDAAASADAGGREHGGAAADGSGDGSDEDADEDDGTVVVIGRRSR